MRINGEVVNNPAEFYRKLSSIIYEFGREYATSKEIREFVATAIGNDVSYDNRKVIAARLLKAVQDIVGGKFNYLTDGIRQETVQPPIELIQRIKEGKRSAGDCDDYVALLHTLYQRVGIPSVTVYVHHRKLGGNSMVPNHIALAIELDGKWYIADPTSRLPILTKRTYERIVGPIRRIIPLRIDGKLYNPDGKWAKEELWKTKT